MQMNDITTQRSGTAPLSRKPRILDLFCCQGGAGMGYHLAGFDVVGVDKSDQPRYPFPFIRADALELLRSPWFDIRAFDAIHASPPCQHYSSATKVNGTQHLHPDLIPPVRQALEDIALPYVIENVVGAPLLEPALICGVERGLRLDEYVLRRHRLFETNWPLETKGCGCFKGDGKTLGVYGGGPTEKARCLNEKNKSGGGRPQKATLEQAKQIMEMPWANKVGMNEAIPPAYTHLIGLQLRPCLGLEALEFAA